MYDPTLPFSAHIRQCFNESMADQREHYHDVYENAQKVDISNFRNMVDIALKSYASHDYKSEGFYSAYQDIKDLGRAAADDGAQNGQHEKNMQFARAISLFQQDRKNGGVKDREIDRLLVDYRGYKRAQELKAFHNRKYKQQGRTLT